MNRQMVAQAPKQSSGPSASGMLQRKCDRCRKKDKLLQRSSAISSAPETMPPIVHEVLRSPGLPLDPATRAFLEPRVSHDFSRVRVHTEAKAAESARAVNALAYTVGEDVVFGAGQYLPATPPGLRLLAHELTHVVQQQNDTMRSHHIMKKEPQNTPPKTPPPAPAAKVNECEPARPLTWGDYSDKVPQGATFGANTPTRIHYNNDSDMFQLALDSANVWAMPQAKNAADNGKNGCQEQIKACEKGIDENPGKTGHIDPPTQRKCPAGVIPKRVEFKTKRECTTIFGEECKKALVADAALLLKHEQLHFTMSCILVNKANQALKAGKDFYAIKNSLAAKWPKLNEDYDTETKHRCDQAKQDEWQKKVDQGLPNDTIP